MEKLMLHVDSQPIDRDILSGLPVPPKTDTWQPVSHIDFIEMVDEAVVNVGIEVRDVKIGLSAPEKDDNANMFAFGPGRHRMFGVIETNDMLFKKQVTATIGFRNSTDKSFAASVCMGSRVFVCDNRSFFGEHVIRRKHTVNVYDDLPFLIENGLNQMVNGFDDMRVLIKHLDSVEMDDHQADHAMVEACAMGVMPWAKIPMVRDQWREPKHDQWAPRNAWSLYNNFTEVLKPYATDALASRTMRLTNLFTRWIGPGN